MSDRTVAPRAAVHASIHEIAPAAWDACAGGDNPFISHAFLAVLEDSGSVCAQTGWQPCHISLTAADGRVVACAPLYLKSHSYGEYVFDWSWAEAFQRAGGQYYPKLQCAVPFTPATGARLLTGAADGAEQAALRRALLAAMRGVAEEAGASSLHITFPTAGEAEALGDGQALLHRVGLQYHWHNAGYGDFDDFLAALSSRRRKDIRKEREKANAQGVRFRTLSGPEITPRHWRAFYGFYLSTIDRKWSNAYLTQDFFRLLGDRLGERVVLVVGEDETTAEPVCGALNLRGRDTLYGRNWGALERARFLHFEACYYRAIDYAIAEGLRCVEAGAQGEHKIQRGYRPTLTHSLHWLAHPGLHSAVRRFVGQESAAIHRTMADLDASGPYRASPASPSPATLDEDAALKKDVT